MPVIKLERYTLQKLSEIVTIHKKIMKKKPKFHRKTIVKQNCRIWGSEKLKIIIEKPLYPQCVTACCGFYAEAIIEPYFFKNEAGAAVSVNGLRYRTMINEFLWPELEDMDVPGGVS